MLLTEHTRTTLISTFSIVLFSGFLQNLCRSQELSFEDYIRQCLEARINQTSTSNQKETPSVSSNTTSLVDRTSVGDLFSFALNLARFTQGTPDSTAANSATITVTPYALYAAAMNVDPLNPEFYNNHKGLRRVSFTYGFDDPSGPVAEKAQLYGLKVLMVNGKDASAESNGPYLNSVTDMLQSSAAAFGRIKSKVQDFLFEHYGEKRNMTKVEFLRSLEGGGDAFGKIIRGMSSEDQSRVNQIVLEEIEPFQQLSDTIANAIEHIRNAPQLSLSLAIKRQQEQTKKISLEFLGEYGLSSDFQFIGNAAYQEERLDSGGKANGGKVAIAFQYATSDHNNLSFREPLSLSFSGSASWMKGVTPLYQWQLKSIIPVMKGFAVPLALTWTKESLIDEGRFSAQLGFALDFAKLIASE